MKKFFSVTILMMVLVSSLSFAGGDPEAQFIIGKWVGEIAPPMRPGREVTVTVTSLQEDGTVVCTYHLGALAIPGHGPGAVSKPAEDYQVKEAYWEKKDAALWLRITFNNGKKSVSFRLEGKKLIYDSPNGEMAGTLSKK